MADLTILCTERATDNLVRFEKIAEFFGIETERIDAARFSCLASALNRATELGNQGVVVDVQSLRGFADACDSERGMANQLTSADRPILLLVTDDDEQTTELLDKCTAGFIPRVHGDHEAASVKFPEPGKSLSRELSSYSYPRERKVALTLITRDDAGLCTIMELDGGPCFVRMNTQSSAVFVWSTSYVFDIHRPLVAETEFELTADEYIPAIIFLRFACCEHCWHNPELGAGIVIDDPLLRQRYGFIDFRELLASARRHQYYVTLAFIPWNHWRTRGKQLELFRQHDDCFGICPHGCDHTENEFGLADYDELLEKSFVARERMGRLCRRTGLKIENLMVCPQERYSFEAMKAFADSRQFLGLVCTACMPRNLSAPQLTGADLLWPAQDSFFGVPVLKRHYWSGMAIFGMSLFLGKPAILVEHHEFFRGGPRRAEEFARGLAEMRPDLRWRSLEQTFMRTHALRHAVRDVREVRFFTDTFSLTHELERPTHYRFFRRIPAARVPQRVLVDGNETPFRTENDLLTFETHIVAPQELSIQLEVAPIRSTKVYSPGIKYRASVALRRGFSEFRDNVVARNQLALKASRMLRNSFTRASA